MGVASLEELVLKSSIDPDLLSSATLEASLLLSELGAAASVVVVDADEAVAALLSLTGDGLSAVGAGAAVGTGVGAAVGVGVGAGGDVGAPGAVVAGS